LHTLAIVRRIAPTMRLNRKNTAQPAIRNTTFMRDSLASELRLAVHDAHAHTRVLWVPVANRLAVDVRSIQPATIRLYDSTAKCNCCFPICPALCVHHVCIMQQMDVDVKRSYTLLLYPLHCGRVAACICTITGSLYAVRLCRRCLALLCGLSVKPLRPTPHKQQEHKQQDCLPPHD